MLGEEKYPIYIPIPLSLLHLIKPQFSFFTSLLCSNFIFYYQQLFFVNFVHFIHVLQFLSIQQAFPDKTKDMYSNQSNAKL